MKKAISESMSDVGNKVADAAKSVGTKLLEGAEKAIDFAKEKTGMGSVDCIDDSVRGIREHMDVIASCGKKIGVVDEILPNAIKLTRKDSPDAMHHFIPSSWVCRVDGQVHLNKNSKEAEAGWQSSAGSCGCG